MSLIEFKNVTKIYKLGEVEIPALGGVDFDIEEALQMQKEIPQYIYDVSSKL